MIEELKERVLAGEQINRAEALRLAEAPLKELTEAADEAREHKIQFFLTAADDGRIYAETLAQETGETITLLDPLTTAAEGNPSYTERMRRNIQAVAQHWKEAAT